MKEKTNKAIRDAILFLGAIPYLIGGVGTIGMAGWLLAVSQYAGVVEHLAPALILLVIAGIGSFFLYLDLMKFISEQKKGGKKK